MNRKILAAIATTLVLSAIFASINPIHAVNTGYLTITDDSYTERNHPNANHGNDDHLLTLVNESSLVPESERQLMVMWFKIDISPFLNNNWALRQATLAYSGKELIGCSEKILIYYSPVNSWSENTITWSNQPPLSTDWMAQQWDDAGPHFRWLYFNITSAIQKGISANSTSVTLLVETRSILLCGEEITYSCENPDTTIRPYISVTYTTSVNPTISPTTIHFIMVGETQTFTCTVSGGTPPYTYSWYLNSTLQTGGSNQFVFTPEAILEGTYNLLKCNVVDNKGQLGQSNTVDITVPLANRQISQVEKRTDKLRLCGTLYYASRNKFVIRATLEDLKYKDSGGLITTHPLATAIQFEMNSCCTETPTNHQPHEGDYGSSQVSVGFSFYGIGFSIMGPAYRITFKSWYNSTSQKFICRWEFKWGYLVDEHVITGWPWIDYVETAIGVDVPEGFKPTILLGATTIWYSHTDPLLYLLVNPASMFLLNNWYPADADGLWAPPLDPPGALPISPGESINLPYPGQLYAPKPIQELDEALVSRPYYWAYVYYAIVTTYWVPNQGYAESTVTANIKVWLQTEFDPNKPHWDLPNWVPLPRNSPLLPLRR